LKKIFILKKTKIKMKEKFENTQKCEFLLELGKNIICQRYFTVRNFNPKAANSVDLYEGVKYIVDEIKKNLVLKTILFLDSSYRENSNDISNEGETFTITIKVGNKKVLTTIFPSSVYPPKIRYTVDIRPQISYILRELTEILSSKKVNTKYQDYSLIVNK
tara:strand:- start:232 stop:714 length:483 start_codon:yes stop_codon:yes gene_type:complete